MTGDLHPLLREYYAELDPAARKRHLDAFNSCPDICGGTQKTAAETTENHSAVLSDHENALSGYRNALFEARHINRKKPSQYVDRFLLHLMSLMTIYKNPGLFPKRHKKEVLRILRQMQVDERPAQGQDFEDILYLEYCNAIRRYFDTCADPAYASKLLGLAASSKEDKERHRCYDTWAFSYGIAGLVDLQKEMEILCRAANDTYAASVPGTVSLQEAYRSFGGKI